jgi:lysyl-tRNA synthetase class 2
MDYRHYAEQEGKLQLGDEFDFSKTFERISVFDSILHYNANLSADDLSQNNAAATDEKLGITVKDTWGLGKIQIEIFEATVEEKLIQPHIANRRGVGK